MMSTGTDLPLPMNSGTCTSMATPCPATQCKSEKQTASLPNSSLQEK